MVVSYDPFPNTNLDLRIVLSCTDALTHFRPARQARKVTQIMAVVAVSFGAYIHGTTVVYPAVAIPSLKKSNESGDNSTDGDALLPFHVTDDDISLIGNRSTNLIISNLVIQLAVAIANL
jgi:hypothetical protein